MKFQNLIVVVIVVATAGIVASKAHSATLPSIPNLVLHLDASDPLANGGSSLPGNGTALSAWHNKASGSLNATATAGLQPLWFNAGGSNNTPLVRFDGVNDRMTSGVASDWKFLHDTTGSTVFMVYHLAQSDPDALYGLLSTSTFTTAQEGYQLAYDDRSFLSSPFSDAARFVTVRGVGGSPAVSAEAQGVITPQTWNLQSSIFDFGNIGNDAELLVNGTIVATDNSIGTPGTNNPTSALHIGSTAGTPSSFLNGDVAEILIFDRALSLSEQIQVGSYLETKYLLGSAYPIVVPPPVPEPSSFFLLGLGLLCLRARRHRKA